MTEIKPVTNLAGKAYWRSLDQLAETPEFKEFLHREFPKGASELNDQLSRRTFLKLMGASMALAGLSACRRPVEKIVPYVVAPEEIIPGIAQHYATTMPVGARAYGVVVKSHEGRPTKIEGNPKHPSSLGASDRFMQAALLGLYDPDRSTQVLRGKQNSDMAEFAADWQARYAEFVKRRGAGLAVLSQEFASPTLARLKKDFMARFPLARWVAYEPVNEEQALAGVRLATGRDLRPVYDFAKAKVVVALDADIFLEEGDAIAAAKGFSKARHVENEKSDMNRLYVVESRQTVTGGMADHRMRLQHRQIPSFAAALALMLNEQGLPLSSSLLAGLRPYATYSFDKVWIRALAKDLMRNSRRGLIIAGRNQPVAVHALVLAMNQALANVGNTLTLKPIVDATLSDTSAFAALVKEMQLGRIDSLLVLGGNPIFDAPADLNFAEAMRQVPYSLHLGLYADETAQVCAWHVPQAHFLEAWGDARGADGSLSIVQPLIAPLFGGKSTVELLAMAITGQPQNGYEQVRETWRGKMGIAGFEAGWRRALHDGIYAFNDVAAANPGVNEANISQYLSGNQFPLDAATADKLEVVFQPSSSVYDGRYINNGWLQELPDPITQLTWDNAACISPKTAAALALKNEQLVKLSVGGKELTLPVWIVPGQADFSVLLTLGYGRQVTGKVGKGSGFNVYPLRSSRAPYAEFGATLARAGGKRKLSTTQLHGSMEGRPLIREASLEEYRKHPEFAKEMVEHPPLVSLFKEHKYDEGYQWGMAIDLNSCVGCGACTIACQSENNIPVVGREQVRRGREMHWIRVDRYYAGNPEEAQATFQPVTCQHCENAPCEQVCPVAATVHDSEGLNVMTYNRCIGTRYCSNNCPYKVRRFNFLNYTSETPEVVRMAQNPDVTVRFRGVMEKCTYCVQRLSGAKLQAKLQGRKVRDGEAASACQQACPTDAIVFGDLRDPESRVARVKQVNRNYELLGELNTKPRTSYLAKLRNPNPEIGA